MTSSMLAGERRYLRFVTFLYILHLIFHRHRLASFLVKELHVYFNGTRKILSINAIVTTTCWELEEEFH